MKKEKDILFLCQYFYPEYVSSATLPFDTALSLRQAGFKVGALCGYPKEYNLTNEVPLEESFEGIQIKRLKYIQLKRSSFLGRLINYFSFTATVALNFKEFKKYKAIIVYSNPPVLPFLAGLANKFYKTKIVFVSYDIYPEIAYATSTISEDSMISKMMRVLNRSIFMHVHKVVALSNEMKSFLLKHRTNLSSQQIEVIPNWYEDKGKTDVSESLKNRKFSSLKTDDNLVVSYFGNMGVCQDLDTLIDAIRQLNDNNKVHFLFAGHGNKMETLKATVANENLNNVTIFDFLHGQDFQDALNISDCFVVSLEDGLTGMAVPSKTYSYMMASKPVIAIMGANSDIAIDLTENDAGFSMEVGESAKLVTAINDLLNDKNKRESMGGNCRKVFLEKYTKKHCTNQYIKMMHRILED